MKILLLLITLTSALFSLSINESLLKVHATLVPKIYLMDYKFKNKLENDTIKLAIVYKESKFKDAQSLKNKILLRYKNGIKSYKVEPILIAYKNVQNSDANIYYLFPASKEEIKSAVKQANTNSAITFSYLKSDLNYGVMISLKISKKIKPILNLTAIKNNNIAFRPVLIDISTVFKQSDLGSTLNIFRLNNMYDNKIYSV